MQAVSPSRVAYWPGRFFTIWTGQQISMLGMLGAGPLADWVGARTVYLIGGLSQALLGTAAFAIPALMNVEEEGKYGG